MGRRRRPTPAVQGGAVAGLVGPFRVDGHLHRPVLVLYGLVNGLVLVNALLHHPAIGYDALDHLRYVRVLAQGRLPTPAETLEYFSPPLAYLGPALLDAGGVSLHVVAKAAQLLNVVWSLLLTAGLLRLCDLVRPGSRLLKPSALGLLGMLPVYYKTFAFVRPEPLLACLAVWSACGIVRLFAHGNATGRPAVALGVTLGLLLLTRQQAVLWMGGAALVTMLGLWRGPGNRGRLARAALAALAIAVALGGGFYLHLSRTYGSPAAFNRPRQPFSLANRPWSFYVGLGGGALFRDPIRPSFRLEFWPKLYAETWGDHESYFLVYGRDTRSGGWLSGNLLEKVLADGVPPWLATNRYRINGYLGRVNLVSLLPSALLAAGVVAGLGSAARVVGGRARHGTDRATAALGLLVAVAVVGYFLLLVMYPTGSGDTVKATYLIHVFPLAAVMAADLLDRLHRRAPGLAYAVITLLAGIAAHDAGASVTRYSSALG